MGHSWFHIRLQKLYHFCAIAELPYELSTPIGEGIKVFLCNISTCIKQRDSVLI